MKNSLIIGIVSGCMGALLAFAFNGYFHGENASAIGPAYVHNSMTRMQDSGATSVIRAAGPANVDAGNHYSNEELINIAVYEKANRSVVNIRTEIAIQRGFYVRRGEGAGSGWVLDKTGHIVTNYHVIEASEKIEVTLFDGTTAAAQLVGTDPANDIALLKIDAEAESLFPVELGDSDFLRVGQKAIAIGNPFGFERSMSAGIISSLNRALESQDGRMIKSIVQVDAALNQGNSGGPLLDSAGKLIGMNTAIRSATTDDTAQNSGVGFAIPVNTIRRVVPQLKTNGRVIRASVGVVQAVPTNKGLALIELQPDGPAANAGIKAVIQRVKYRYGNQIIQVEEKRWNDADFIQEVDGVKVRTFDEFLSEVEKKTPGETLLLKILRGQSIIDVKVTTADER